MNVVPLDIDALLAVLDVDEGAPIGTVYALTRDEAANFGSIHVALN